MEIDSTKLAHLNKAQLLFSAKFLRTVFVENKIFNDPLNTDQLETIRSIFIGVPSNTMKTHLLDFLNHQNQHLLLQQLSPSDINSLFDYYDNLIILKSLIKTFEPDRLSKLLQRLYKTNKDKYHALKESLNTTISIVEGVIITKTSEVTALIEFDIDRLLKLFQSDTVVIKDMDSL